MKISVVGLGYIGLPTALVAASRDYQVAGFDVDEQKVKKISEGISPIVEPGVQELLSDVLAQKKFCASTTLAPADCFVIAVPTPFYAHSQPFVPETKRANLDYVFQAGQDVGKKIKPGNLVILESTVPVGTTRKLAQILEQASGLKTGKDFFVAYCPERVLPGKIVQELVSNDRVIGGVCKESAQLAKKFYKKFVKGTCFVTNDKTAEMVKLVENSSRDVAIAFANQIAGMCNEAGIDPFNAIALANKHPRVNILQPGCGVGGHCIAVDPWFLIETFPEQTKLLHAARQVNDTKPHEVVAQVLRAAKACNKKPTVLALGVTFKPNVDDMRESPALQIAKELQQHKNILELIVCDPFAPQHMLKKLFDNVISEQSLGKTDIVVALVKHSCFPKTPPARTVVIDPCGLFSIPKAGSNHEATFFEKGKSTTATGSNATGSNT